MLENKNRLEYFENENDLDNYLFHYEIVKNQKRISAKTDIKIVIHDLKANLQPELGFSIKFQLDNAFSLLSVGRTTNFIYEIKTCNLKNKFIKKVNLIDKRSKIKDRLNSILYNNYEINFARTEKEIFGNNLTIIDSLLPNILAPPTIIDSMNTKSKNF